MQDKINREYLEKYEQCLAIVDYGSKEKRRDTAFAMTWLMAGEKQLSGSYRHKLLEALAYHTVQDNALLDNLRQPPSDTTGLGYNYSPFRHLLCTLAGDGFLNRATVRHIFNHLEHEYKKYSGGSCMQDSVYNVPFYGFNCAALNDCLKAFAEEWRGTQLG